MEAPKISSSVPHSKVCLVQEIYMWCHIGLIRVASSRFLNTPAVRCDCCSRQYYHLPLKIFSCVPAVKYPMYLYCCMCDPSMMQRYLVSFFVHSRYCIPQIWYHCLDFHPRPRCRNLDICPRTNVLELWDYVLLPGSSFHAVLFQRPTTLHNITITTLVFLDTTHSENN